MSGTTPDPSRLAASIGATIRRLRREAGLTLDELAARSGLSQPYLSQAETGKSTPSVMSLHRIAVGLGVAAGDLLASSEPAGPAHVRAGEGPAFDLSPGVTVRFLAPGGRRMELNEVLAGPRTAAEQTSHVGEEYVYVLEGAVRLEHGEDVHDLAAGDSLYYAAATPHRWSNPHDAPARFLMGGSPATF